MPNQKRVIYGPGFALQSGLSPLVMGILNVTPDSFSDGDEHFTPSTAIEHALKMVNAGADVIDIGGESSRPGSSGVSLDEELGRVIPVIESLAKRLSVPLSIDTRHASVATAAIEAGCTMVNDITACSDPDMIDVLKISKVPVVLMHMKGQPESMQTNPTYEDVVGEVTSFLVERADLLERSGIEGDKIIIDPGIGFGKRFQDNLDLLRAIEFFRDTGYAILVGGSRKSFLGELLDAAPNERLAGSLAVAAWCHRAGVEVIRVHDVKETVELFRVLNAIEYENDVTTDR